MSAKKIESLRRKLLEAIRKHMEANNITQEDAAEKCGWHQQTVSRMLNGDFGPKLDHLLMLCDAIGIKLEVKTLFYKTSDEG